MEWLLITGTEYFSLFYAATKMLNSNTFDKNWYSSHAAYSQCSIENYIEWLNWKRNMQFALADVLWNFQPAAGVHTLKVLFYCQTNIS